MERSTTPPFWKNETKSVLNGEGKSSCVKYLLLMKGQLFSQVEEDKPRVCDVSLPVSASILRLSNSFLEIVQIVVGIEGFPPRYHHRPISAPFPVSA
jgi:hypothetical protein